MPEIERTDDGVTQAEVNVSSFWSLSRAEPAVRRGKWRHVVRWEAFSQFALGLPLRLDAFSVGEVSGDHLAAFTGGYLRQLGRLPDFLGGDVHAGLWLENGAAFDSGEDADINTHVGVGMLMDTLLGPVVVGTGVGVDGAWRMFFGIGSVFGR